VKVTRSGVEGVLQIEPDVFADDRGHFFESFNHQRFEQAVGCSVNFVQDNHSRSSKGVLRGLHFQDQMPQGKLVRVVSGKVFDVAVDLRRDSPTIGKWVGAVLSADNKVQHWIPEGFAHGFLALTDGAEVLYKSTDYYAPEFERRILWKDPQLAIEWPIEGEPILSSKDQDGMLFSQLFNMGGN
jgi:dTDP-4-dehydrorhamnose 3,5-epimerase